MAPILPGLTDTDESIEDTVAAIAAAGAVSVTPLALHLRPGAREWYAAWLTREHPHLAPRYRELFGTGSYLPRAYQREIGARVRLAARRHGLHRAEAGEARQVRGTNGTAQGHADEPEDGHAGSPHGAGVGFGHPRTATPPTGAAPPQQLTLL
jgi:DNA repair photolyase